jgi:hypothetical protein
MALDAADFEKIAALIEGKVASAVESVKADVVGTAQGLTAVADSAPVQEAEKEVEYYVHMADGTVQILPESQVPVGTTHLNGMAVIGRYEVGA